MGATIYNDRLPFVSIKPNQLTIYYENNASRPYSGQKFENFKLPKSNQPKRGLSDKARKRIKSKIHWLLLYSKTKRIYNDYTNKFFNFKINFITLTLPTLQFHTDKTIKSKAFNQFLTELRQYCKVKNYVWRAECQSNGNIHFHLATDTYIPWYIIRRIWNRQLDKLGYIDKYHNKFKNMTFQQYKKLMVDNGYKDLSKIVAAYNYGKKTNWKDPNTTDIHSVHKIKNLAAYLSKYMAKMSDNDDDKKDYDLKDRKILGRNWGCSQSLSRCKSIIDWADDVVNDIIDYAKERLYPFIKEDVYYQSYFFNFKYLSKEYRNVLNKLFLDYKNKIGYVSGGLFFKKLKVV